jgi:hypothetical protein
VAEGGGEEQTIGAHTGAPGVFISYASHDAAVADTIVAALERAKILCWIAPRDVKPGARYADAIVRAINEASALVLVLSANAMGSDHVAREVERAASKRKQVIAFRIDTTALSPELEYLLSNSQWIDAVVLAMPVALGKLAEAVGQGWGNSSATDSRDKACRWKEETSCRRCRCHHGIGRCCCRGRAPLVIDARYCAAHGGSVDNR